jgi:uncharacterized SAM-binding protein YcdF (DUF218 family)
LAAASAIVGLFDPPHPWPSPVDLDAALVLSGDVDYARLDRAVALFRSGVVRRVVITGQGIGGDDAVFLANRALHAGVREDAIAFEHQSHTTRENVAFAAPLLRRLGCRRVALVTSGPHMARALLLAQRLAPDLQWSVEPVPEPGPSSRVYRVRFSEWAKLGVYWLTGWS